MDLCRLNGWLKGWLNGLVQAGGWTEELDPSVLVWDALDVPFALQRVEAVDRGFIRRDLAAVLDLPDEWGSTVGDEVALDELVHRLLLFGQGESTQR